MASAALRVWRVEVKGSVWSCSLLSSVDVLALSSQLPGPHVAPAGSWQGDVSSDPLGSRAIRVMGGGATPGGHPTFKEGSGPALLENFAFSPYFPDGPLHNPLSVFLGVSKC